LENKVVKQASWTPRYDLILDSTSKTAQIIYKAHFLNYTFEDWQDAHIRLSTSVTTFAGLSDTVPLLTPWNVKLGKRNAWQTDSLHSLQEQEITKRKKLGSAPPGVAPQQMMQQVQLQAQQQQRAQMMQQQFAQQQVVSNTSVNRVLQYDLRTNLECRHLAVCLETLRMLPTQTLEVCLDQ